MSTWLRDYLYLPLGGNRLGKMRTYLNLMLTMLLGGLWHGANWTFVIWGGIHGIGLAVERLVTRGNEAVASPDPTRRWFRRVVVFHFVCLAWIFFRIPSLEEAWRQILGLAAWHWDPVYLVSALFLTVLASVLLLLDLQLEWSASEHLLASRSYPWRIATGSPSAS